MNARTQITLEPELQKRGQAKAADLGISFAEYVRRLIASDVGQPEPKSKSNISIVFDLVDEGPSTNIAREKNKMIGHAVWEEYLRATRRKSRGKGT
jgi:hypothetical protein